MEKQQRSFVKGAAILGIAGILVKIIGAAFRIPLANAVGPIGMSYYEAAYPYYSALIVISTAGLPTAISKQVSERVSLGDFKGARDIFRAALLLLTGIGVVTALIMFLGADALARLTTFDKAVLSFQALAPALFFVSVMCAFRGYLQGLQQMTGTAISQIVEQVFKLIIGLSLAIKLLPRGPEYAAMGALIGVTISELFALAVILPFYLKKKRAMDRRIKAAPNRESAGFSRIAKTLLLVAVPVTIGASISSLAGIVDSALIGRVMKQLGFSEELTQTAFSLLRTNVTTLVNMPGVLTMALAMSLVPAISSRMIRRDASGVKSASLMGLKLALAIGLPCAVGLFVLSEPILALLYPRLEPGQLALAADLMRTASIGVIFLSLVQTMTGVIQGMGKPNIPVFFLFIGFVLKVVTMLILMNIPSINIQGAAVSTVVCYAFAGIMDTVFLIRRSHIRINALDVILKPVAASLAMGGVVYLLYALISESGHRAIATLVSVAGGMVVYAMLALVLKLFSREELAFIPGGKRLARILYGYERKN